jgi:hypothetical protein
MGRVFSSHGDESVAIQAEIRGLEAMESQTAASLRAMKEKKVSVPLNS